MGLSKRDYAFLVDPTARAGCEKRSLRKTVGFIPARGGSKGLKNKNLQRVGGFSLVGHAIIILKAAGIQNVFVSTEDADIKAEALLYGALVINRPVEMADHASPTEEAIGHFLEKVECEVVVMVQCTSPLLQAKTVRAGLKTFHNVGYDSLFSAVIQSDKLLWTHRLKPLNYDPKTRGMRQGRSAIAITESGGFYIFTRTIFDRVACRIGGRTGIMPVPFWQSFQVDDGKDLGMIEKLMGDKYAE